MILTLEIKSRLKISESEIAICFDNDGLELFINKLEKLRNARDHEHMRTPDWAGAELTEIKQGGEEYTLLNHLRLVRI
jgi:5'-deoxynucleotidase YfbR-like HD superfamily hydrolase